MMHGDRRGRKCVDQPRLAREFPRLHGTLGRDSGIDPVRIGRLFLKEKLDEINIFKNRPNYASECLLHVARYNVEASQGAATSECARAAPDGCSTTLAYRRGLKRFY
ncbi:hypothetical protein Q1695_005786 [Nippostrongylus brasiliensis]|nr:hypothetical protein Q1695_005786 [Nippostrongylus brasiliensis]